jgi:CRP-like cAMP-binding protein
MEHTNTTHNAEQDLDLMRLIESIHVGQTRHYRRGCILYWQGDPVEAIFMIKKGAVKVSSVSTDGRTYTYSVLGPGGLVGAETLLLGKDHEALAEAVEDTEVLSISAKEFERLLREDHNFCLLVMRKMAQDVHLMANRMRAFNLLDVQQRLKSSLIELANEHGVVTEKGIKIDIHLTHEEIGEIVAANRTTITACLSELRRQGYLWKEGRRLFIIPPEQIEILDNLDQAVVDGSEEEAIRYALAAVGKCIDPYKALEALSSGMRRVDRIGCMPAARSMSRMWCSLHSP